MPEVEQSKVYVDIVNPEGSNIIRELVDSISWIRVALKMHVV